MGRPVGRDHLVAERPSVTLGEATYLIMPQLAATLTLAELGARAGTLEMMRDEIVRAIDALLSGI